MFELPGSSGRASELAHVARLASNEEILAELGRMGGVCGKINSVLPLPVAEDGQRSDFLVTFDRAQDALFASRQWHCYLFGFTSVLVSIRRQDFAAAAR